MIVISPRPIEKICVIVFLAHFIAFPAFCQDDYERGKIAITFKDDVPEKDADAFAKRLGLEVFRRGNFELSLQFNVESNVGAFASQLRKEAIVDTVAKGEKLTIGEKEGTVVRVKFYKGADKKQIEDLGQKYKDRQGVIAWRYFRRGPPFMVLKVPSGQENNWMHVISRPEHQHIVENVSLVMLDIDS